MAFPRPRTFRENAFPLVLMYQAYPEWNAFLFERRHGRKTKYLHHLPASRNFSPHPCQRNLKIGIPPYFGGEAENRLCCSKEPHAV